MLLPLVYRVTVAYGFVTEAVGPPGRWWARGVMFLTESAGRGPTVPRGPHFAFRCLRCNSRIIQGNFLNYRALLAGELLCPVAAIS